MLTPKQHELICYISERQERDGFCPSFEEMMVAVGLKSKSGVHRLVNALIERKFLARIPHRARALEVLRLPSPLRITGAYRTLGKEILLYGEHYADAKDAVAAKLIADAMNARPQGARA